MFDASCIFPSRCRVHCCRLGNAVLHQFPKRNREILVGKLLPQGAVGIGRHLGCLYGNNAVQTDVLLIHLVQYGQCHMEFEYTEQRGKRTWSYTGACLLCLSIRLYQRWFSLSIEQINPVFKFRHLLRPDDGAIQVNKVSMAMKYAFITSISFKRQFARKDTTFSSKLLKMSYGL